MRVAFLDRDGTIIHEPPDTKLSTKETFAILPGAIEGLRKLKGLGFQLVIVSNQGSGSPKSYREESFRETQMMLEEACGSEGMTFDAVFMCPHTAEDACECRKPKTGMVDAYLRSHDIDLTSSVMIGDRETDGAFAKNIGVRFVRGNGSEFPDSDY